jgi:hypothetical protein
MSYSLNSENFSIERPLVPYDLSKYRDEFIIIPYIVESKVEVDVLKI